MAAAVTTKRGNCEVHFCIVSPGCPDDAAMARGKAIRNLGNAKRGNYKCRIECDEVM
jgi:hypothetical protein